MFAFLTQKILNPPALGLDISDFSVKFVRLERKGSQIFPDLFGEVGVPEGVIGDGDIKKDNDLAAILKDGLRDSQGRKVHERFCVVSLPEEQSFVRVISLPPVRPEDMAQAVKWEVEGVIPLNIDEIVYDYAPMLPHSSPEERLDVLVVAFPKKIVESYTAVLNRAGLIPLALELESQAIARAVLPEKPARKSVIIVDIGATRTSFSIFESNWLIFPKTIPVGGRVFESAIAAGLNVSPEEAEQIKIEVGLDRPKYDGRVFEALKAHIETITSELQREIWFYQDHLARGREVQQDISEIILCGGDANLNGLVEFASTVVKKPILAANPFLGFNLPPGTIPPIPRNRALKYATAIGLALRAIGY